MANNIKNATHTLLILNEDVKNMANTIFNDPIQIIRDDGNTYELQWVVTDNMIYCNNKFYSTRSIYEMTNAFFKNMGLSNSDFLMGEVVPDEIKLCGFGTINANDL